MRCICCAQRGSPCNGVNCGSTPVAAPNGLTRVSVTVGLTNDTSAEILSGLNEGDWYVSRTVTTAAKTATTAAAPSILGAGGLGGGAAFRTGGGGGGFRGN